MIVTLPMRPRGSSCPSPINDRKCTRESSCCTALSAKTVCPPTSSTHLHAGLDTRGHVCPPAWPSDERKAESGQIDVPRPGPLTTSPQGLATQAFRQSYFLCRWFDKKTRGCRRRRQGIPALPLWVPPRCWLLSSRPAGHLCTGHHCKTIRIASRRANGRLHVDRQRDARICVDTFFSSLFSFFPSGFILPLPLPLIRFSFSSPAISLSNSINTVTQNTTSAALVPRIDTRLIYPLLMRDGH